MLEFWLKIFCLCGLISLVPYKLYEAFLYFCEQFESYEKESND